MRALRAEGTERSAVPGLVSVPTTHTGFKTNEIVSADKESERSELFKHLGAFTVDAAARRLSGLRMAVGFAARAHAVSSKGFRDDTCHMVTLTYAGDNSAWKPEHLTKAMTAYRNWCKRNGYACRYVWVAELQKRGVIHYHIATWLPKGVQMPFWDAGQPGQPGRLWWKQGMSNRKPARHATAYLMSYLKKGDLEARGTLPKGARNYGVGGLDHSLRRARRWLRLPAFVQARSSIHDDWRRCVGGGWVDPSGAHWRSEFEAGLVGGKRALWRVVDHGRPFEPSGGFSWLTDRAKACAAAVGVR